MWGAEIISDQSGMYAGLFTHMDADADKYGAKARKQINKDLYGKMGTEDERLVWWNPKDANNKDGGYQQEKFKFSDIQTWMGDYVWMRIEEMYLIAAEAECRLGNDAGAREYLMDLMSKRDASYSCAQKSGTSMGKLTSDYTGSLLEEIIIQRRIELWGEFGRIRFHIFFRPIPTGIKQHIGYIVFCGKINTSHTASRCQCNFTNYLSGLDPASVRNLIRFVQVKNEVIIFDQFSRKG